MRLRFDRIALLFAIVLSLTRSATPWTHESGEAHAEGTHVRLRGSAHIDAHGARAEGEELLLDGTLRDDAGSAIANETVNVTIAKATSSAQLLTFGEERRTTRSCVSGVRDRDPVKPNGTVLPIKTGDDGRFCVRVSLPIDRYVAHVTWNGSPLIDGAKLDLPIDLSRRAVVLKFDPEPRVVWITGAAGAIEALATIDDNGTTSLAADVPLMLSNERGVTIASATTNGSGRAHFAFDPSRLGPPGRGELRVAFGGNADSVSTSHAAEIERHTRVDLALRDGALASGSETDRLPPGWPEDGVSFVVTAKSPGGDVPNGSVEARAFGQLVGAGTVERGEATVVVTFSSEAAGSTGNDAAIELKYAPSAPWYEPAAPHVVHLPLRGPSPWRQVPLVIAGLAVVAWFVVGRTARRRNATVPPPRPKPISKGEAKIEVVRAARDSQVGWSGSVIDAHDGSAVAGARVAIERPAFGRVSVVASAIADGYGRFELRPAETRPGDELAIEAALHGALRKPMPPAGELEIALVLRKRALLARLVAWARQRGRPFDSRPEPTPGHIRKSAGKDFTLARWADAVERAAFAGGDVDARLEAEVDGLAPVTLPPPASPAEEFAKLPLGDSNKQSVSPSENPVEKFPKPRG